MCADVLDPHIPNYEENKKGETQPKKYLITAIYKAACIYNYIYIYIYISSRENPFMCRLQ